MINSYDAWSVGKLLVGAELNGEISGVSEPFRGLVDYLATLPTVDRQVAWQGYLRARVDRDTLIQALANADPSGPPPEGLSERSFATLADIARVISRQPWLWPGWLAAAVLNAVAAEPGTGKTRFALDLARRLWFKLNWPDGQENDWPEGTRTLWIQGDRNFAEMLQAAQDYGLPPEAVALGSTPDDPTGGLDLDDPAVLASIGEHIRAASPAMVVIDTVGMVTNRNLCRPEEARAFFAPIMELAQQTGVAFLGLTHLSKDKEALGRRIVEKARVVLKMTQPEPEGQRDRRRLWVDKSAIVKPPPLGITMGAHGNDYDSNPPSEPEQIPRKRGPAPEKLEACKQWLTEQITPNPAPVAQIRSDAERAGFAAGTLYAAKEALGTAEYLVKGRKWWKLSDQSGDSPGEEPTAP